MTTDRPGDPDDGDARPGDVLVEVCSGTLTVEAAAEALCDAEPAGETGCESLDVLTAAVTGEAADADVDERMAAAAVLANVAAKRPSLAPDIVSVLRTSLEDPVMETVALRALATVADGAPETVDPALSAVGRRLPNAPLPARQAAVQVLDARTDADPAAASEVVEPLVTAVASGDESSTGTTDLHGHQQLRRREDAVAEDRFRLQAAGVLEDIAAAAPGAVGPELDQLGPVLDPETTRNVHLREKVADVVRVAGSAAPDTAVELAPSLVALVDSSRMPSSLRGTSAGALAALADVRPELTTAQAKPAVPSLETLLADEDPSVRAQASTLLSYVAKRHPDSVASATESLVERLDDDHAPVRASIVWTLATLDIDRARTALQEMAETDPDADVRALASELYESDTE